MKKILSILAIMLLSVSFVMAYGSVTKVNLIGNNTSPIYTEEHFTPLLFLSNLGGRIIYDDPYGFFANGNASARTNNYLFTGEQIQWTVLVWDKNGVPEKINDIFAGWVNQNNGPLDPEIQGECQYSNQPEAGTSLAQLGYSNVRRPGDQEPQITFNPDTMGIYTCKITVEPNCHGQKWFGIQVIDLDGLNSTMQEAESWFCNPSLDLDTSGTINFGTLGPGEQGASTFSVKNAAEDGSGVEVILSISGKDFYDPSPSGGLCPTTNQLALQGDGNSFTTGFWYTAVQGSKTVGNKRIPYSDGQSISSSDPVFSSSSSANQWRRWVAPYTTMSPGSETTMTLHLGLPQPCNGQFTEGTIDLWALAI